MIESKELCLRTILYCMQNSNMKVNRKILSLFKFKQNENIYCKGDFILEVTVIWITITTLFKQIDTI